MRERLVDLFRHALAATEPGARVAAALGPEPRRPHVLAVGKAAWAMLKAVEAAWPRAQGFGVTRYGHGGPLKRLELLEAGHPVPDEASEAAARRALELARGLGEEDTLLVLVSGGGSALWAAPWGVSLEEKRALTRALLNSGATILEVNAVRKHLSRIKGGRLAEAAYPARVVAFYLSDVPGDDVSAIASGPTAPDSTTFEDALAVLDRYRLEFPQVRAHLRAGARGELPETPKPGSPIFARVENRVIAAGADLLAAAAGRLRSQGARVLVLSDRFTGEARDLARFHAAIVASARDRGFPLSPPFFLLSGGEASVTVRGGGRGGRNLEFLLALLWALGPRGVWGLAADSDGIDGSTDAAGAVLTPESFHRALSLGLDPQDFLERNDAYTFFRELGDLLVTGPTGNNLNDFRVLYIDDRR